jgi:hypothetical protein
MEEHDNAIFGVLDSKIFEVNDSMAPIYNLSMDIARYQNAQFQGHDLNSLLYCTIVGDNYVQTLGARYTPFSVFHDNIPKQDLKSITAYQPRRFSKMQHDT